MNNIWKLVTLQKVPVVTWHQISYLGHTTKLLQDWQSESILLSQGHWVGLSLTALVFIAAPFVSTTLIGFLLLACAALWGLLLLSDGLRTPLSPIHLAVMSYWGVATIATAFSPVRDAATDGWIKLTLYLILFALIAKIMGGRFSRFSNEDNAESLNNRNVEKIKSTLRSWVIGIYLHVALVVSAVGLRQWFFGVDALATWVDVDSSLAGTTRVYSYLGNPNLLAGYLIPATLLSLGAVFAWKRWAAKALAVTMLVVNAACLVLTFSRGGWLGFGAGGFVFIMLLIYWLRIRQSRFWRVWTMPMVLGGIVAGLAFAIAVEPALQERFLSIFAGHEDSSNSFRIYVWRAVIEMIQARPILGIGPGNDAFNLVYPFYQEPGYTALSAYSIFLEVLVETGIVGFICFVWLVVVTIIQGWLSLQQLRQDWDRSGFWLMAAIAIIAGMVVHGAVDTVWYRPQVSTLWWLMMALVASYCQPYRLPTEKN
ncbi:MAG: IctB family putative bicarbonate transporter [Cyanobacteria bacterium P01_F01_bin.150]